MAPSATSDATVLPLEISVADAYKRLASSAEGAVRENIVLIDVREPWEVALAALPRLPALTQTILLPLGNPDGFRTLPIAPIAPLPCLVLCHHGVRSLQATHWLRAQGVGQAQSIAGGIDAWARHIDSSIALY